MRKQEAEKILESWLNPVLGFALKRCKTPEDAEDLSQEIILRVYRALLLRDDVEDVSKFIWTVAHNALCNYYRSASKNMIGIPVEALADLPAESAEDAEEDAETVERLKKEIAYLSGLQRKIVIAYYIDHKKQEQIARELGIPVGTVKWHLFEAKKELKKGMGKMREASSLKYNPVRFVTRGITGSLGRKDVYDMFGSPLVQNLCYAVRDTWKTVNEIADDLGVSPVYLEDEAARLEEFGFLKKKGDKYLADFLLEEPSLDFLRLENDTYKAAADLFADELYTRLTERGVLDSPAITGRWKTDKNFLLWALIPYIAACSGDSVREMKISFEEAATVRKDGGTNIFHAQVREAVPEMLTMVGLSSKYKANVSELSGGEQQRVAIARALVNRPKLLLADEPTGNLDAKTADEIMQLLEEINRGGTTVLVITHSREIVQKMGKRVIVLDKGMLKSDREQVQL